MLRAIAFSSVAILAACTTPAQGQPPATTQAAGPPVTATLVNNSGTEIGQVRFTPAPTGVLIRLTVNAGGLSPGWHGTHLHAVGDCSDPAKFEHAGSHIKANGTNHGLLYASGPENGDLPNLWAASDGSASAEMFTNLTSLREMQDADGSGFVIHAGPDDHMTQPTGNSGDRVACAALRS